MAAPNGPGYPDSYYVATAQGIADRPLLDEELTADVCVVGGGFTGLSAALTLADGMVRIRAFTHDLVDYADFFIDRFEVTNSEFQRFVEAGGYEDQKYWNQEFVEDGD